MEKDEELLEGETDSEEELFDLNLDDLTPDEIDQELREEEPDEEEIIELTELVEKGEKDFKEEEQLIEDLADLEAAGETMSGDEVSPDGEGAFDQLEEDLDFSDISLESELGLEQGSEQDEGPIEEQMAGDDLDKVLEEGIDRELETPLEDSVEAKETKLPPEGIIGLSEEKIEAIVSRVVEEVVERVARETMASVAERVITEAIDALKQSLESGSA